MRKETGPLAEQMNIRARTPPVFLVHASDDSMADAENSVGTASGASARGWP